MAVIRDNKQIIHIKAKNLQKPARSEKFDSTLDERERNYSASSPQPRFKEYR